MTITAADIAPMTGGQDHVQLQASCGNGAGPHDCPSVVCLHASASSGRQWRALETRLAGRYRVSAPDLYGAGGSPPWPGEASLSLADEVAGLEPILAAAGESFHLVGHSYGGAVAAHAALADDPGQPAAREIARLRDDTSDAAACGALDRAGERFTDYWMGPGAWAAMPPPRRAAVAQAMPGVRSVWSPTRPRSRRTRRSRSPPSS